MLQALREDARTRDLTVVAVTANAMPADIERGRQAGFHDYLTKPIDLGRFETDLRRWLAHAIEIRRSSGL